MSAARLLTDLARLGIHLEVQGDDLRYRPQSAVTLDLVDRMKASKDELIAILRPEAASTGAEVPDAVAGWQAALDLLEGDPEIPPDVMVGLRAADVRWADDEPEGDGAGDDLEVIDVPEPCAACGGIMFWWNPLGEPRCIDCHPTEAAQRLIASRSESTERGTDTAASSIT